ncbi:MAG: tRNA pseudouridine(38-40) synthase TruA [Bacteroidota bacterium]|nr:tRNA pseudouridine(38-40) synthase TruA [Bacteroidota bacterium]
MALRKRFFIFISYDGTFYHGWQVQPGKTTIQSKLEDALSLILRETIKTTGAGRTDTGVHARSFVAHFDSSWEDPGKNKNICFRLNTYLPPDILVNDIREISKQAHARYDAISRTYRYYITLQKDPFREKYTWYRYGNMDIDAMNQAGKYLLEYEDFTSFSKLHTQVKNNICKIYESSWVKEGNMLVFTIRANRFLRNMVRAIVGTMVEVGTGKIPPGEIENIIQAKDRSAAGISAPAKGLILEDIEYDPGIFV